MEPYNKLNKFEECTNFTKLYHVGIKWIIIETFQSQRHLINSLKNKQTKPVSINPVSKVSKI